MTNYIVCPECGYKLFKLGDGSNAVIHETRHEKPARCAWTFYILYLQHFTDGSEIILP